MPAPRSHPPVLIETLADAHEFTKRGIPLEIARRRPYVRWTVDDRTAVEREYKDLPGRARGFISRVTGQCDGWLIMRNPPPELPLERIYAELRPDRAVKTGKKITHDHATAFREDSGFLQRHLDAEHDGEDVEGEHTHDRYAKYLFPPAPKVEREWWHDHDEHFAGEPHRRAKHEAKAKEEGGHDGEVVSGPHPHSRRVRDKKANYAKRLDVHRDAIDLLPDAERVFYVIEGCLKADSILAQGEAVFSVPSVTLWDAQELDWFARKYLTDKRAFIVADADWSQNPKVVTQAMLCRTFLRDRDIEAHVSAPPDAKDESGELRWKGVDDFLGPESHGGGAGSVDDLVVIRRELPDAFDRHVRELGRQHPRSHLPRIDGLRRDILALQNLILIAADGDDPRFPKGTLEKNLSQIAKLMGHQHHKGAERAIKRLADHGLLRIDGPAATEPGGWKGDYYDPREDWVERPTITITPELQAVKLDPKTVGELTGDLDQFPIRQEDEINDLLREGRRLGMVA